MSSTNSMPVQSPDFRRTVAAQMEDYKRRMAATIKRERLRHGQKPVDIAYKIGVDKRTYERWEEAETAPQPANLKELADAWGVEVTDLRPDLQGEAERLNRIEQKLDAVVRALSEAGLAGLEDVVAQLDVDQDEQPVGEEQG